NRSTVRGLAINRFSANGLVLGGNTNTVEISYFGIGVDGATVRSNGQAGILITGNYNTVGGALGVGQAALAQFNVIGGNTSAGILISGTNAYVNVVVGNFIGVSIDGVTMPNAHGVRLENGTSWNRIGGAGSGEANQIVAN